MLLLGSVPAVVAGSSLLLIDFGVVAVVLRVFAQGSLQLSGQLDGDWMDGGARALNPSKPLRQRHAFVVTEHFAVLHVAIFPTCRLAARLKQEILAKTARWCTKLIKLSLDLQALELVLIIDLGQVGPMVVRVARRVGHGKYHVAPQERQTFLLATTVSFIICS